MSDQRTPERKIRDYALHLALIVRRRGKVMSLSERYRRRRRIGTYRSWRAVEQAITDCNEQMLGTQGLYPKNWQ